MAFWDDMSSSEANAQLTTEHSSPASAMRIQYWAYQILSKQPQRFFRYAFYLEKVAFARISLLYDDIFAQNALQQSVTSTHGRISWKVSSWNCPSKAANAAPTTEFRFLTMSKMETAWIFWLVGIV